MLPIAKNEYTARVDRTHPTAFLFLIDQSGSMDEEIKVNNKIVKKDVLVAKAINTLLRDLVDRCTKPEEIRHYFDIALIGYGTNSEEASFISLGSQTNTGWITPEEIKNAAKYRKEETVQVIRGKETIKEIEAPYWFEPVSVGATPMYNAFQKAKQLLKEWCAEKKDDLCYPPIVINITDGVQTDATDEEMVQVAQEIMQLRTLDGNVLVFNIHLSNSENEGVAFPSSKSQLEANSYAEMLYEMSSTLPSIYNEEIEKIISHSSNADSYKAMGYNQNTEFVNMLNIGTMTNIEVKEDKSDNPFL